MNVLCPGVLMTPMSREPRVRGCRSNGAHVRGTARRVRAGVGHQPAQPCRRGGGGRRDSGIGRGERNGVGVYRTRDAKITYYRDYMNEPGH